MIFESPHPDVTIPPVSLPDLILARAERLPDKTALVAGLSGRAYTFGEFAQAVRRVSAGLIRSGLRKGDVLALVAPNSPEYGIMFLASALAGGINTTLNPAATSPEIESQFRDSGTRWVFTTPDLVGKLPPDAALRSRTILWGPMPGPPGMRLEELVRFSGTPDRVPTIRPETDVVALPYSSGTTGIPKGVQLTHRNIVANLVQTSNGIYGQEDTILGLVPFFHIYGLTVVLYLGLYLGSTNVTLPRFELQLFLDVVERYGISHANLVPPLILMLSRNSNVEPHRLRSLQSVQSGAAPLAPEAASRFMTRFACRVTQGYGLSEASPVTHIAPREWDEIPSASIGPPVAGTECRIVDLETGRDLGPGQRGELYVRGPQVMSGYLNAPEKTAEMIDPDGWLHTGDIALADERGHFYVVDRAKELIKFKGYAVAPAELEALLLTHPEVQDAAVVPFPDESAGEVPKAFVVRSGDVGAAELIGWIAQRVAPQKKIRKVEFVDRIPKSPSGKILRRLLVDNRETRVETEAQAPAAAPPPA